MPKVLGSSTLDALNMAFTEQTFGTYQQEQQGQHVGEPVFDPAANKRPQIDFGEFFARAHNQAADNRARHL